MGMGKVFAGSLFTLILFNMVFYLSGYSPSILNAGQLLGTFITIGLIAIGIALIPFTTSSSTVRWFMSIVIVISLIYSVSFNILTWNVTIGVGLSTNLANMFPSSTSSIAFMPWLFFTFLGLLGLVSGIVAISTVGDG